MKVNITENQKTVDAQKMIYLLTGKSLDQFVRGLDNELYRENKREGTKAS